MAYINVWIACAFSPKGYPVYFDAENICWTACYANATRFDSEESLKAHWYCCSDALYFETLPLTPVACCINSQHCTELFPRRDFNPTCSTYIEFMWKGPANCKYIAFNSLHAAYMRWISDIAAQCPEETEAFIKIDGKVFCRLVRYRQMLFRVFLRDCNHQFVHLADFANEEEASLFCLQQLNTHPGCSISWEVFDRADISEVKLYNREALFS